MSVAILEAQFWRDRIKSAIRQGEIHRAIFDCSLTDWDKVQKDTAQLIHQIIPQDATIFDAGCGVGALVDCLGDRAVTDYTGIDLFTDLISIAKIYYPNYRFLRVDIHQMQGIVNRKYDYVIARSVFDMIQDNLGDALLPSMREALLKVGTNLLIIEYKDILNYQLYHK